MKTGLVNILTEEIDVNILVLFEESGTIRDYAIDQGHNAVSVDLFPGRGIHLGNHIQSDVCTMLDSWELGAFALWNLVIMHPPCTSICVSGNKTYSNTQAREEGIRFAEKVWAYPFKRMCLENPVGVLSTRSNIDVKPQYIQPYNFGHDASKKTGLWLCGLRPLIATEYIPGKEIVYRGKKVKRWANQSPSGASNLGPSPDRSQKRSQTYQGIAEAMIDQWTN